MDNKNILVCFTIESYTHILVLQPKRYVSRWNDFYTAKLLICVHFYCKKERIHLSFPPKGAGAAEAFQSIFNHTDGKIRDRYGEDGCGRKVVGTERLIVTQHSPYL
jgi:hypothetical protein